LQVPLLVGNAFSAAAQHSFQSPGMCAALHTLAVLLSNAAASGLINVKDGAAAGSLAISMRQQLQQAGVLQNFKVVMAALAADLRSQAAALAKQSQAELCSDLAGGCFTPSRDAGCVPQVALKAVSKVQSHLRALWGSVDQTGDANSSTWVGASQSDSSGFAEATMQLSTAALQHTSSVLWNVLLAVGQSMPQQTAELHQHQFSAITSAMNLQVVRDLAVALPYTQLHLSPHCLPCVASWMVVYTSWISKGCNPKAANNDGSGFAVGTSSSSDSSGSSVLGGISRDSSSSRSSALGGISRSVGTARAERPSLIQLQLFSNLGLSPQLTNITLTEKTHGGRAHLLRQLQTIFAACAGCYNAAASLCSAPPQKQTCAEQRRWQFEQQVWLLLPLVLLPSANRILLQPAASTPIEPAQQQMEEECVAGLIEQSGKALITYSRLHRRFGGGLSHGSADAWMQEVLGVVLQLADQLLLQQPLQQPQQEGEVQGHAAATSAVAAALGSSEASSSTQAAPASSRNSSSALQNSSSRTQKSCTAELLALLSLLSTLVYESRRWLLSSSAETGDSIGPAFGDAEASVANPSSSSSYVPPVAERFVEVCTALEAGLRAVTTAIQRGLVDLPPTFVQFCLLGLLIGDNDCHSSPLALHMHLRGPAASVLELRQIHSMLSTVQKLGRCKSVQRAEETAEEFDYEVCWGQQVADACCWAAAQAAVGLLKAALPDGSAAAAPAGEHQLRSTPAAAAEQLQWEVEYLPSLVIFGRCCLVWAEQLDVMLSLHLEGGEEEGGVDEKYSAAHVCIPGWQQAATATGPDPCMLERLMATVTCWVGGVTLQAAHTALAAAAGGDLWQFRQQLEALSAAQQEARRQQHLGASILLKQLYWTGEMLSSIAVPHFCNNSACDNISGPTQVQLVTGPSCVCAGCRTARYCGRDCQRQAWREHQKVCKAIAAAAAAATPTAASDTHM
jgi:hypothetical protein